MEKHCKVIFLEDINGIIKIKNKNGNLFILSDEEIKEGDWYLANDCYHINDKPIYVVRKCDNITNGWLESNSNIGEGDNPDWSKKIIATTDSSLVIKCDECKAWENRNDVSYTCTCKSLPQPSHQFIEKCIEEYNKGNQIEEVMVEYILVEEPGNTLNDRKYDQLILKVNSDKTINIKSAKNSWTKDEVIELLHKSLDANIVFNNKFNETFHKQLDKWIEENL